MRYSPLELFIKAKKNTLPESIWVCIAAALTSTFYFYEYQYEAHGPIREYVLLGMSIAIYIIWIWCSLLTGRDGKFGFAIFTFLYWGIPFAYTLYYAGRDNLRHYDKWLALLNRIFSAMLCNPFSETGERINVTPEFMAALLVLLSLGVYILGFFLKRGYDAKFADNSGEEYDGEYVRDGGEEDDEELQGDIPEDEKDKPVTFNGEKAKHSAPPDLRSALGLPGESEDGSEPEKETEEDDDWTIR